MQLLSFSFVTCIMWDKIRPLGHWLPITGPQTGTTFTIKNCDITMSGCKHIYSIQFFLFSVFVWFPSWRSKKNVLVWCNQRTNEQLNSHDLALSSQGWSYFDESSSPSLCVAGSPKKCGRNGAFAQRSAPKHGQRHSNQFTYRPSDHVLRRERKRFRR